MRRSRTWIPLTPLDWITLSLRFLWLATLPLVAGLEGRLTSSLIIVSLVWIASTVFVSLLRPIGWQPSWIGAALAGLDVALAVTAISLSGALTSPLWWSLLIGTVSAGLSYGLIGALATTAGGAVLAGVISLIIARASWWALLPILMYVGLLTLAGSVLGWLSERVRQRATSMRRRQELALSEVRERERQRARTVFRIAAELNATLNYERVLDMALDLSAKALSDSSVEDDRLVSALLLFDESELRIVADRRLTHADRRVTMPGVSGVIGRALNGGEPRVSHNPAQDHELRQLVALHTCEVVVCIPLLAGLASYGVLLFGHPWSGYFNPERVELLEAIGQQAVIALQNARLYRDLELEKERITEIQEEARKKLARDLHDGPTQSVAAIAMRVNFARRLLERDSAAAADELFKVEDMARRTTKEIRHMLFTLRPLILESQGLVAALYQLAEKIRETHSQNVIVEAEPDVADEMEMNKQAVIFYIAEEAINNARKHAEAAHVWVRLRAEDDDFFVLDVRDDGVGFNVGAVDRDYEQRGSLGIVNMRERTELVNGLLRIESAEGKGTRIALIVPLTEESADRLHRPGFFTPASST